MAAFLSAYRRQPGVYDEMLDEAGEIRPHYRPLIEALAAMAPAERAARFRSSRQYLREAGVFYRVYGTGSSEDDRGWPLAHPALVIEPKEWAELEAGLVQRASFLEKLGGDLYGTRSLIAKGHLPAALVGRNPEFLRPLGRQGLMGKPLIRFIAVDLGRGPDGRWWVLGDRTQAPSGAGFALENRVATSRAFPEIAAELKVQRIAGFFGKFRDSLFALNGSGIQSRIGLLTPGPANETYFEHAYLARYLGFLLLEGGDLVVHGSSVEVRTVDGFKPLRVLWRRLDADFADPLELFPKSYIGTPGLVRAVRSGEVEVVNALGSGILETRALLAFQPSLAEALLGTGLKLPTIATWWGGTPAAKAFLEKQAERLSFDSAFPPGASAAGPVARSREALRAELSLDALGVVGQEVAALSTAPVFVGDRLEARPVALRVFLARNEDGWHVMPGGFARVADATSATAVSMQAGGRSIDVWVGSQTEAQPITLLGPPQARFIRRVPGALPARAADNLYWLGRYAERAEVATRLLRLHAARTAVARPGLLEEAVKTLLAQLGVDIAEEKPARGLLTLVRGAFDIASRIRDRFSPDGWRVLGEIVELLSDSLEGEKPSDLADVTSAVLTRLAGFTGLVRENMYQFAGWRFLSCGRSLERARSTATVASRLIGTDAPEGALEALLEFVDSRVTYRRRYSVTLSPQTVLDLAVLDPLNPRSVAFQVNALKETIGQLPGVQPGASLDQLSRRIARLQVRLVTAGPVEVDQAFLDRIARDLGEISDLLGQRYFAAGPDTVHQGLDHE
ncbi:MULTISPECIES: circularly permuted type 2 ATP-grasp protein [unclassified Aureimonas]|uniref:circularly permuted type 2 ATP-grasp protein n=1 Tax=unclassified Aureimonas TaxID=2615206 RepID=UPI000AE34983|nr:MULTISPECIES: circularly permuted type 2 ATP-grasp protein [unclassified Aureimonas]